MEAPKPDRHTVGFTLLEVSIALFLLALVLGGAASSLAGRVEAQDRRKTAAMLDEIRHSLYGYVIVHGHLPCPDCRGAVGACAAGGVRINDGVEDGVDGEGKGLSPRHADAPFNACAVPVGNLPWVNLGVRGRDAWRNRFTYGVSAKFTRNAGGQKILFHLGTRGDIDVKAEPSGAAYVSRDLAALVLSHGRNGGGAAPEVSAFEQENLDADALFVERDYSRAGGDGFDDMLTWISSDSLILQMVKAGRLP